jgi:hypothetical protein
VRHRGTRAGHPQPPFGYNGLVRLRHVSSLPRMVSFHTHCLLLFAVPTSVFLDVVNWLQWTTVLARTQHNYTNRVEDASINDMLHEHPLLCARLIPAVPSCCALGVVCCCTLSPGRFSPPCSTRAITIATTAVFPSHHAGLRCYMPSPVAGLTPWLNFSCRCHSPRRTAVLLSPTPLESNLRAVPQHPTVL